MPNEQTNQNTDEITPILRKALVEIGVLIPISPSEVVIADSHFVQEPSSEEENAAFTRLEQILDDDTSSLFFMRIDETLFTPKDGGLAMAARNGEELDSETLAKIKQAIAQATRIPPSN